MPTQEPAVWIVDDDPDDQLLMGLAFRRIAPQVQVVSLSDGDELLPCLQTSPEPPSLVLLDLNMQRMNGFETLSLIRSHQQYQTLPIVVLTTSSDKEDQRRALGLGATSFLTKPNTQPALFKMLQQVLTTCNLSTKLV